MLTPLEAAIFGAEGGLRLGRFDEAEELARKALAIDAHHPGALGCRAESLLLRGDLDAAEYLARSGLARFPEDPRLCYVGGEVARQRGRLPEAIELLRKGAQASLEPTRWERLARALAAAEDKAAWDEGVAAARRALALDPVADEHPEGVRPIAGDPIYHRTLGDLRRRQGRLGLAAAQYARALACAERLERTRGIDRSDALAAGEVHEQLGLPLEAIVFYEMATADKKIAAEARRRIERLREAR